MILKIKANYSITLKYIHAYLDHNRQPVYTVCRAGCIPTVVLQKIVLRNHYHNIIGLKKNIETNDFRQTLIKERVSLGTKNL